MPIGLQIMGRPWAEATVLALAAAVEVHTLSLFPLLSVMVTKTGSCIYCGVYHSGAGSSYQETCYFSRCSQYQQNP